MTVTQILPLDKRRSKVILDEDFVLVLYKGEIRRYELKEGGELDEGQYREILDTILRKRARERTLYLLKSSDKTEKELRRKLEEGFYPPEVIDYAVEFVKSCHYIDDENYGRRYVETYASKKSLRQIRYDLQQKGLSGEAVQALLEEQPVDEEEQIRAFLRKKGYEPDASDKDRQKLMAALGRRGYSYEAVGRVIRTWGEYD